MGGSLLSESRRADARWARPWREESPMMDFVFALAAFVCFGVAHAYVVACEKLKARPTVD